MIHPISYRTILLSSMLLCIFTLEVCAQEVDTPFNKNTIEDKFKLRAALEAIKEGDYFLDSFRPNYDAALEGYERAQAINPNNIELNLKIATCYLYSPTKDHMEALPYYEKALELDPSIEQYITFNLGEVYHRNRQWKKAIEYYEKDLKVAQDDEAIAITNKRIEECRNGIELSKRLVNIEKVNLGTIINSQYDEYGAVITANDSAMYFTSRRSNTVGGIQDEDGKYYEDIYVSTKVEGEWTPPRNMSTPVNSKNNDAVASISPNGDLMIIYREADLYYCRKSAETGQWTNPKAFPKQINTRYMESSAAFSVTGDTLYFTSDRADLTMGGLDIFYSIKISQEGKEDKWSDPVNLGTTINTPYYEEGVFIHPEGHTLYFSSTGHNTMGGYDIFRSELVNGKWSAPQNIGLPMNTPEDELYLSLNRSGRYGYYSSRSKGGLKGEDLYRVTFLDIPEEVQEDEPSLRPLLLASADNLQNPMVEGKVQESSIDENTYFAGLTLNVLDEETNAPVANVNIDATSMSLKTDEKGKVATILAINEPSNEITINAVKGGYATSSKAVVLTEGTTQVVEIRLKKLKAKQVVLADQGNEDVLIPTTESPSTKMVAIESGATFNPTTISIIDKESQAPIEGVAVTYYYLDGSGQKKEMSLTTDNRGLAKAIVPMNENYTWKAIANGYKTKEVSVEQKFSRSVYFQLEKKAAKEFVVAIQSSPALSSSLAPSVSGVNLASEATLIKLNKQVQEKSTGKPIVGVAINILSEGKELQISSDYRGYVKSIYTETESFQVEVSAEGYLSKTVNWNSAEFSSNTPIVLTPKAERTLIASLHSTNFTAQVTPPSTQNSEVEVTEAVEFFTSKVLDASSKDPVQSEIQIVDKDSNSTLFTPNQRSSNGAFFTYLPLNLNLMIVVEAEGYLYHSENFKVNVDGDYELSGDAILLKRVDVGESITLNNVIFEVSRVDLQSSSFAELDRLANIMKKNPTLKIEISGHTDYTRGRNIEGLVELSLLRAKSVKTYLVEQGIDASRMVEKGYGPSKPIVSNNDQELKYLNRRVDFEILSK